MKSLYSIDFKSRVLNQGYLDTLKKTKKQYIWNDRAYEIEPSTGEAVLVLDYHGKFADIWRHCKTMSNWRCWDCANRLLVSEKNKRKKIHGKTKKLVLSQGAYFLTLTFTDEVLAKTSVKTRRRYVARFLKANCERYCANIDFGKTTGREHYHAIVDREINAPWKYGFYKYEPVETSEKDALTVSNYVAKLTNHALKVKQLNTRIIYSRTKF